MAKQSDSCNSHAPHSCTVINNSDNSDSCVQVAQGSNHFSCVTNLSSGGRSHLPPLCVHSSCKNVSSPFDSLADVLYNVDAYDYNLLYGTEPLTTGTPPSSAPPGHAQGEHLPSSAHVAQQLYCYTQD